MATAKKANNELAHWYPSFSYTAPALGNDDISRREVHSLWSPKSGKAAANMQRANVFAASAEAAYKGYASTRKVKMPEKAKNILFELDQDY